MTTPNYSPPPVNLARLLHDRRTTASETGARADPAFGDARPRFPDLLECDHPSDRRGGQA